MNSERRKKQLKNVGTSEKLSFLTAIGKLSFRAKRASGCDGGQNQPRKDA